MIGPDDFRALARSSPWRCSSAHVTRRTAGDVDVEAWLERPDRLRTRTVHRTQEWLETPVRWARDVTPITRDDGLVLVRPDDAEWPDDTTGHLDSEDPMYDNYRWVAMLDPRELARGVEISGVRETAHRGRVAWAARCMPTIDYDPRCGCCELLWSEVSIRAEARAGGPDPDPDAVYPEAYDVVLEHATGFVVSLTPVGETSRDDLALDVEIHSSS